MGRKEKKKFNKEKGYQHENQIQILTFKIKQMFCYSTMHKRRAARIYIVLNVRIKERIIMETVKSIQHTYRKAHCLQIVFKLELDEIKFHYYSHLLIYENDDA